MTSRIAVIGAGVSGLTAASLLSSRYSVTVFEAGDYLGGHTHTHDIDVGGKHLRVDTGFIVYNDRTYPNFMAMLARLGCEGQATEMSFSVSDPARNLEWAGHNLDSLFAQRTNLVRPGFYRMIADILRFNREARQIPEDEPRDIETWLRDRRFGTAVSEQYLLPMAGAIWSTGRRDIGRFPVAMLARFFVNHGLLDLRNRPQWYVVRGGSDTYVRAIETSLDDVRLNAAVTSIKRHDEGVELQVGGERIAFDEVVIATHSDQALAMLSDPSKAEREILGSIRYTPNTAILHTDARLLPNRRRAWSAWNYRIDRRREQLATLTYNMNILQGLPGPEPILVTLNDEGTIAPERVIKRVEYAHPLFDRAARVAQCRHGEISGVRRTHYAGAYWSYGFHEDGVTSALRVYRRLGSCAG